MIGYLGSKAHQHFTLILFVASLGMVGAIDYRGCQLHMHQYVDDRAIEIGFPGALSRLHHHGQMYDSYLEIHDGLVAKGLWEHSEQDLSSDERMRQLTEHNNKVLSDAKAAPITSPNQLFRTSSDDKGIADLAILAFLLFGPKIQGLYHTLILILLGTVLCFFAAHRNRRDYCLAPLVILGGIFAAMPSVAVCLDSYTLTNVRVIDVVGLIPVVHLGFSILGRQKFSVGTFLPAAFQVLVLVEWVHIRHSALWLFMAVAGLYLAILVRQFVANRKRVGGWVSERVPVLSCTWVVAALVCGFCTLKVYQRFSYDKYNRENALSQHVFWHNIGMGFHLHPVLARAYNLKGCDDTEMVELVRKHVVKPDDLSKGLSASAWIRAYGWGKYDERAREVVFDIVLSHPLEILSLFFYYKPRCALETLAGAAGFCPPVDARTIGGAESPPGIIKLRSLHVRFVDFAWLALALVVLVRVGKISLRSLASLCALLFFVAAASFLPTMATYPYYFLMACPTIAVTVFLLSGALLALSAGVSCLPFLAPGATSPTATPAPIESASGSK